MTQFGRWSRIAAARAAACLLLGTLLIGLAGIASLPPFEGFDETAHYSYIQQIAETGTWPKAGDPVSAEVDDYLRVAPAARMLTPPRSYADFFAASADIVAAGENAVRAPRDPSVGWRPGTSANWQAQHPPLYYLALAPFYEMSRSWSLAGRLVLLRSVSYLLAWSGLCLAVIWGWRRSRSEDIAAPALILAPALWPILFPMWFPEMARLGNDSLVLLLCAGAWWAFAGLTATPCTQAARALALGATVGLALLTKATALPLAAAVAVALCWRVWAARGDARQRTSRSAELALYALAAAAIAGWWFIAKYSETGTAFGTNDVIQMNASGGLLSGLAQHASIAAVVRGVAVMVASFLWAGTWSVVKVPPAAYAPFLLTMALLAVGYARALKAQPRSSSLDIVPLLLLCGLLAGLLYHLMVMIAFLGSAAIGGWYLHAFVPVFAVLLARSLVGAGSPRALRNSLRVLVFYPLIFLPFAMLIQMRYFAGCAGSESSAALADVWSGGICGFDLSMIGARLSRLAAPVTGLWLFAIGWVVVLVGLIASVTCWQMPAANATPTGRA